jgi:hypothetical protein
MKVEWFINYIHIPTRAKYFPYSNSLLCWALLSYLSVLSFEIFWKWFAIQIFLLASPNNIGVPLQNMRPPLIYPQLPHFYNHGLAIPFYFIWKEIFVECFSPRLSSKSPSPQKDGALKREREREKMYWKKEERKKLQKSLQIKRGSQYFERTKTFQLQNLFMWVHFSPSIIPFSKPFPKSFGKVS